MPSFAVRPAELRRVADGPLTDASEQLVQLARTARSAPPTIETGPRWGDLGRKCTALMAELAADLDQVGHDLGGFRDRTLQAAATYEDMEASNLARAAELARSVEQHSSASPALARQAS